MKTYRLSHSSEGYGEHYERTYAQGYYHRQWRLVERPLLEQVLGKPELAETREVMDFACGTGRILEVLVARFPSVVGVDVSGEMLGVARAKLPQVELLERDITAEAIPRKFDLITAFRFFLNAEPLLKEQAMSAIASQLRDGGYLLANVHVNRASVLGSVYQLRNRLVGRTLANTMGFVDFVELLEGSGFELMQWWGYGYLPRTGTFVDRVLAPVMGPVEAVGRQSPAFLRRRAQSILFLARKS